MERIDDAIKSQLSKFGAQGGMPEVLEAWPEAVGKMVAANAWPARIARDGTLHVNTSSSSWAFELTQLAPTISEKLRDRLGKSAPASLRFAVGHLPEEGISDAGEARTETPAPSAEALQRAAELSAGIEDEELRKRVERAVALGLSKPRYDLPF